MILRRLRFPSSFTRPAPPHIRHRPTIPASFMPPPPRPPRWGEFGPTIAWWWSCLIRVGSGIGGERESLAFRAARSRPACPAAVRVDREKARLVGHVPAQGVALAAGPEVGARALGDRRG